VIPTIEKRFYMVHQIVLFDVNFWSFRSVVFLSVVFLYVISVALSMIILYVLFAAF
jgi:hypothetical protein